LLLKKKRLRDLQLKRHLLLPLKQEKRKKESLSSKLNLIEKLLRLRKLKLPTKKKRQKELQLKRKN
jgi:hypothetical protein